MYNVLLTKPKLFRPRDLFGRYISFVKKLINNKK